LVGGKFIPDDMDGLGLEPGDLTKRMAMPWQADFHDCAKGGQNVPWWPGQRPDDVMLADGTTARWNADVGQGRVKMVENWWRLGRVVNRGTAAAPDYIEFERNDAR
jgi:hypothetical protein